MRRHRVLDLRIVMASVGIGIAAFFMVSGRGVVFAQPAATEPKKMFDLKDWAPLLAPGLEPEVIQGAFTREVPGVVPGLMHWTGAWKVGDQVQTFQAGGEHLKPTVTIKIDMKRTEFQPNEIKVHKGDVVLLRLHALDNGFGDIPLKDTGGQKLGFSYFSGHGFHLGGAYDIWVTGVRKGADKEVVFKATTAGVVPFACVVFCAPDHYLMSGRLIVQDSVASK